MPVLKQENALQNASGSEVQDLYSISYSYIYKNCSGISDALSAAPQLGVYDPTGEAICTSRQASAPYPDDGGVNVVCTYTMNYGKLTTSGSLKTQQYSYDKNGNVVKVNYVDGGKNDTTICLYNRKTPTGIYTATAYEEFDALSEWGDYLGYTNKAVFLGNPIGTVQLIACDGDQVAPGWFNNRYVWEYDPDGYNPSILYFNRWGKIPSDIVGPGQPPLLPGNGNGWVVPDAYFQLDFATEFSWVEDLQNNT